MDRATLATLVKTHQAELHRYLRYLGADRSAADDLVQETFLAAFQSSHAPLPTHPRAGAAWLRGIARNLFLRHCRKQARTRVRANSQLVEQAEATWNSEFLRDGDGFDYVEALRRCLESLSERQRHVLDLRYESKTPRATMAQRLEMTENGVKSLLRRIRARLADCVRKRLTLET